MKTKDIYNKPEIEVINLELEGTMAQSGPGSDNVGVNPSNPHGGGAASSKERGFWE